MTGRGRPPTLTLLDGRPLPRRLALIHAASTRWRHPLRTQVRRAAGRLLGDSLPAMLARYADGRVFRIPAGDAMYAQILTQGEYEPAETAVVSQLLRPGDFAIDAGAQYGWFTLLATSAVGREGRVWAVEPLSSALAELRRNLDLNGAPPVEILPLALGDREGSVEMHLFSGLPPGHASGSTLGRNDYVTYRAEERTLDGLLGDVAEAPAFVKLDVEGAELSALAGAASLLGATPPPVWMLEANFTTAAAFGYEPRELLVPFDDDGRYAIYRIAATGLVPEGDPGNVPHGTSWLCVPEARRERVRRLVTENG